MRGLVALEDRPVLGERQLLGGILDRVPVGILRAALDVVDIGAVHRERHPQPHQRPGVSQVCHHTLAGRQDVEQMTGAHRRRHRPARLADVDHPAAGDVALEGARRLLLDLGPRGIGDRCQLAIQVVHQGCPFKLPIANDPS